VTVAQWVAFLNTVDPRGVNRHRLYSADESGAAWPRFGHRSGGGTYSYWQYPTNPGAFGDEGAAALASSVLDATNGNVLNASGQPLTRSPWGTLDQGGNAVEFPWLGIRIGAIGNPRVARR